MPIHAHILETLPRVVTSLRREVRNLAKDRLTVSWFRVLVRLDQSPCTHKEVAEWMELTVPTVSRMIESMISCGLVKQSPMPSDHRCSSLAMTKKGEKNYQKFKSELGNWVKLKVDALAPRSKKSQRGT